jgi:hypothetical protein
VLEAGVFGQQLVQGRHAAGEPGQVDPEGPEPGVGAVDQLAQGPGRAAVRGAQRDQLAGDLGSAALSMYQRAISPPMEWHTNTTWASA